MKDLADRINNLADIMDSRDIIERIEELDSAIEDLEEERDELVEERDTLSESTAEETDPISRDVIEERVDEICQRLSDITDEIGELNTELAPIKSFAEECEGYGDFMHGETLIRDSYFEQYAQELAEDIGAIPDNLHWPCTCIDWEQAASELQQDYTSADFDGVTYWMRS